MMRKIYLALASCFAFLGASANAGDTTFVQAHYEKKLDYFNNFDTTVKFPNGSTQYRNVYMTFTLGKYQCPAGSQYCGDWDYTVQTFLMTKTGDTLELGRLITPYANASSPRTPWTWKQRYTFDVTDYYPLLKDSATVRIHYSGYSGGFTANIRFAFVEGTPARNVLGVKPLWNRSYDYGKTSDPIDSKVTAYSLTAPAGTAAAEMKFIITGHGADAAGCSEFCSKDYHVKQNGNTIATKTIWRDNCGSNHLYPQSGTWVYDRGNWCPGDQVQVNSHSFPGVSGNTNFSADVDFDAHTSSGGSQAVYTLSGTMVYYGNFNKTLDAQLEDVISPNNHEMYFRENNICGKPRIKVKNTGSTAITSLKIEYGKEGSYLPRYYWEGNIAPLEVKEIELPEAWDLRDNSAGTKTFVARIFAVNNQTDDDATNNEHKTSYVNTDRWAVKTRIRFKTNNQAGETKWKVYDVLGNVVAQRDGIAANTTYDDTLTLGPSCYKLVVEDAGCDGLRWWANPNQGDGFFEVYSLANPFPLALKGYFGKDFGCGFTQYFTTSFPTGINNVGAGEHLMIEASPNPARDRVTVTLYGLQQANGTLTILDAMGRTVKKISCNKLQENINVEELANGVYTVVYHDGVQTGNRLQTRLMITR